MFAVGAIVLLFSMVKVGAYLQDGYKNRKTYAEIRNVYYEPVRVQQLSSLPKPSEPIAQPQPSTAPLEKKFNVRFTDLVKRNEDIVGWITIEGTRIDYPVTQGEDNEFYLEHDVNKEENVAGSIFMDYRNNVGGFNRNFIIYGHDMKNKTMFADLVGYESRWNFENKATIEFDTIYGTGKWIIFSAYTTDSSFDYIKTDFASDEEYGAFLNEVKEKSLHHSDVEVSSKDTILTLSTCSSAFENARFVVHAKLIDQNGD
ncbi:SrtB family sortase [Cohnella abietis]|uniref:SrtB family sortase n=1 Tax=Cohnella abietis TaxID=2507935 RepID=A0A3T1D0Q3_9BACL|nr:SrtB family sortase [Cohnella abietis]